ncbi:hypothetical protein [Corallococcus exiguus]|uniref:hypothetical protein n=1 Tax=Corallococcus exiguus TaxID=83462 RepID=UPI0021533DA7|nr:hypothetical protein [Corallococcus exiguus]
MSATNSQVNEYRLNSTKSGTGIIQALSTPGTALKKGYPSLGGASMHRIRR